MKKLNNIKILFALTCMTLFALSCDFKGITEDVDIVIANNVLTQEALISIVDITNPQNIEGSDKLKVELIGTDANKFVTDAGENSSKLKVVDGNISLAVNPNYASSEPLKVLLKISGDDYLTTTIPLVMFPEDSLVTRSINIVNKSNTVQGIDFIEDTKTLSGNTLTTEHKITTTNIKATTKTEVKIESGTVFQDANGQNINGGTLKSEVAHFSLDTPESLGSFPGGLTPNSVIGEDGNEIEDSAFLSAGFTSVDMFVDGKEVKKFSKPIEIGIEIPSNYINPETGSNIAIGDKIPIWSYDDGQWGYHKVGTVSMGTGNNYKIVFTTTHLSWYNLDFHYWGVCDYGRKLTVSIPKVPSLSADELNLSYELVYASNDQVIRSRTMKVSKTRDNATGFKNTPNQSLKIKLYSGTYSNKVLLYTSAPFNGCDSNTVTISDPNVFSSIPAPPQIKTVRIQFKAKCGDKTLNPYLRLYRYDSYTYYGRTYSRWRYVGRIYNGRGYIYRAKIGVPQKYAVYFGGRRYEYDYTFNSDNIVIGDFEVPGDLCNRLF